MQDHIRNSKFFHRGLSLVLVAGLLGLTACEKKLGAEEQAASSSDIVLTTEAESEGVMAIAAPMFFPLLKELPLTGRQRT